MNIEEKYLRLLHKLIYDKRKNTHGILSSCCINRSYCKNGYYWYYLGYMDRIHTEYIFHIEDFISGNVVFLLPFGTLWDEEKYEKIRQQDIKDIKECFGEDFREDMIIKISEEERQKKIKEEETKLKGLFNWEGIDIK